MFVQRQSIAILPLSSSLAGILFCLWVALSSSEADCLATGCALYKDIAIAGISLWYVGAVAFAFLFLCALLRKNSLAYFCVSCMLIADIALLALMAFTAPCTNCLIVAALFACTFLFFRQSVKKIDTASHSNDAGPFHISWIFCIWGLFFFSNGLALVNEQMEAWIIHGRPDAPMRIYFSPSCPSCRQAISTFAPLDAQVAFLPVAEDEADVYAIATIKNQLAKGESFFIAFRHATQINTAQPDLSFADYIELQWHLLRNKVRFYASDSPVLPLIQMHGMPKGNIISPSQHSAHFSTTVPLTGTLQFEGCSEAPDAIPCPTEPPHSSLPSLGLPAY